MQGELIEKVYCPVADKDIDGGDCIIATATYVCPECGASFKPKWYQISAYFHFMGERLIKCPNCKKSNYCKRK